MSESTRPPLGSWRRLYVVTCVVATLYIVLLLWFTMVFNVPGSGK